MTDVVLCVLLHQTTKDRFLSHVSLLSTNTHSNKNHLYLILQRDLYVDAPVLRHRERQRCEIGSFHGGTLRDLHHGGEQPLRWAQRLSVISRDPELRKVERGCRPTEIYGKCPVRKYSL